MCAVLAHRHGHAVTNGPSEHGQPLGVADIGVHEVNLTLALTADLNVESPGTFDPGALHPLMQRAVVAGRSSALANQMRLILHTVAYWMLWDVQDTMPKTAELKRAEFATIQRRLVKIGARVMETATRIRIAFASAYPDKALFVAVLKKLLGRSDKLGGDRVPRLS